MLIPLLSGRARLVTHVVGWTLVALLLFLLFNSLRGPAEALSRTALNLAFLLALFYGNAKILINGFFETGRYKQLVALVLIFWPGMAALRTLAEMHLFGKSLLADNQLPSDGGLRMFLVFLLFYFLLLLFSTLYQLLENRHNLELRHQVLVARHAEAQRDYLRAQINPHFLFNTLNNIYAAASLQHPNTADMVLRLSELLRYVTYEGQQTEVPLEKEIAQIQAYLELFQLKTEQTLAIQLEIENPKPGRLLAPILLLPLVENALKHGDLDARPDAWLRIQLQNADARFLFRVENTFDADNPQKDDTGGVGLDNIRRRLELLYPDKHHLQAHSTGGIFVASLEIFD